MSVRDSRFAWKRAAIIISFLMSASILCQGGVEAINGSPSYGMRPDQLYVLCLTPKAQFTSTMRVWNPSIGNLEVRAAGYGDVVVYSVKLLDCESCLAVSGNMAACYNLPIDKSAMGRVGSVSGGGVVLVPLEESATGRLLAMLMPVGDNLPLLMRNYSIMESAGYFYRGRESVKLKLVPKVAGNVGRTVWIDKKSGVLLSLEDVNWRGEVIQRVQTLEIDHAPELDAEGLRCARAALAMAANNRGTNKDATAEYASQVLGFKIAIPRWTPAGYELLGVRVLEGVTGRYPLARGVGGVAHLVYYDGLGLISLYERCVPWWAASTSEPRAGNVIEWEQNCIRYLLVGDIDPGLLLRMARSVL
ncbi:MAG: hypothetical protein ACOX38_10005 [Bacillota bacterium]